MKIFPLTRPVFTSSRSVPLGLTLPEMCIACHESHFSDSAALMVLKAFARVLLFPNVSDRIRPVVRLLVGGDDVFRLFVRGDNVFRLLVGSDDVVLMGT